MRSILRRIIPALAASFILAQPLLAAEGIPTNPELPASTISPESVSRGDQAALSALVEEAIDPPVSEISRLEPPLTFSANRNEASCIALAVFHEARGESLRGQQAVAHAIINRVKSPKFPKTACAVVYQRVAGRHQFSFFSKGAAGLAPRQREMGLWRDAMKVAMKALYGEPDPINGAISFYNPKSGNPGRWATSAAYAIRIGSHVFFRP